MLGASSAGFPPALVLLIVIAVAKAVLSDPIDPDFFWHVRVADQLIEHGIGPVPDPFSFMSLPGKWTPFSWLGELGMRWIFNTGGVAGIVGVHALCSVLFFTFIALACIESSRVLCGERRDAATIVAVALATILSLPFLSFRPVTMALVLMAAMTWLLWRDRRVGGLAVWLLVPMTAVLTNLHLYVILFVVGLWATAIGATLDAWTRSPIADRWSRPRRLVWLSLGCSVGATCTPMLMGCIRNAIWFNGQDPMVRHGLVAEIAPFYAGPLGKLMLGAVAVLVTLCIRRRARLGFENLFTLAVALVFLFQMGRFATVFAVMACPLMAAVLPRFEAPTLGRPSVRWMLVACSAALLARVAMDYPRTATTLDAWIARPGMDDGLNYPTAAAAYVESHVPRETGRILNELTWGGYLIWRLGDRYQVFMDGRTLIYPAAFWNRLFVEGDGSRRAMLADQHADAAILPVGKSLLRAPLTELGWTKVYEDERAVVLVPPAAPIADVR